MQTKIVKWGNSQGIRLPKLLLESVSLNDNDIVEVAAENDCIVIRKSKSSHMTIDERFAEFHGEYEPVEINWGNPEGKEIW